MKRVPIDEDALYFAVREFLRHYVPGLTEPTPAIRAAIQEYIRMVLKV